MEPVVDRKLLASPSAGDIGVRDHGDASSSDSSSPSDSPIAQVNGKPSVGGGSVYNDGDTDPGTDSDVDAEGETDSELLNLDRTNNSSKICTDSPSDRGTPQDPQPRELTKVYQRFKEWSTRRYNLDNVWDRSEWSSYYSRSMAPLRDIIGKLGLATEHSISRNPKSRGSVRFEHHALNRLDGMLGGIVEGLVALGKEELTNKACEAGGIDSELEQLCDEFGRKIWGKDRVGDVKLRMPVGQDCYTNSLVWGEEGAKERIKLHLHQWLFARAFNTLRYRDEKKAKAETKRKDAEAAEAADQAAMAEADGLGESTADSSTPQLEDVGNEDTPMSPSGPSETNSPAGKRRAKSSSVSPVEAPPAKKLRSTRETPSKAGNDTIAVPNLDPSVDSAPALASVSAYAHPIKRRSRGNAKLKPSSLQEPYLEPYSTAYTKLRYAVSSQPPPPQASMSPQPPHPLSPPPCLTLPPTGAGRDEAGVGAGMPTPPLTGKSPSIATLLPAYLVSIARIDESSFLPLLALERDWAAHAATAYTIQAGSWAPAFTGFMPDWMTYRRAVSHARLELHLGIHGKSEDEGAQAVEKAIELSHKEFRSSWSASIDGFVVSELEILGIILVVLCEMRVEMVEKILEGLCQDVKGVGETVEALVTTKA